jgi:hypothetical protein
MSQARAVSACNAGMDEAGNNGIEIANAAKISERL